jgi:hypothetical protein
MIAALIGPLAVPIARAAGPCDVPIVNAVARCFATSSPCCRSATTNTGRETKRAQVEAARDAGVNLALFSGNDVL